MGGLIFLGIFGVPVLFMLSVVAYYSAQDSRKRRKFEEAKQKREAEEEGAYQKALKRKHEELDLLERKVKIMAGR